MTPIEELRVVEDVKKEAHRRLMVAKLDYEDSVLVWNKAVCKVYGHRARNGACMRCGSSSMEETRDWNVAVRQD